MESDTQKIARLEKENAELKKQLAQYQAQEVSNAFVQSLTAGYERK